MKHKRKFLGMGMILTITLLTTTNSFAMEPAEQQMQTIERQIEQIQEREQQIEMLSPQELRKLRNLEKQLEQLQRAQQQKQQRIKRQQERQPKQPDRDRARQQKSQVPQNILSTKKRAMKQILLDERDNDMQQLEEQITSPLHQTTQLLKEVERLQIPIDLYLLEPSQELENKAKKMQSDPSILTADQQTKLDELQQQRLEDLHQQLILKQIQQQPKQQKQNKKKKQQQQKQNKKEWHIRNVEAQQPFQSGQPQLPQINQEQMQELEENMCCIGATGCTEEQGLHPILCKNPHSDLICKQCLKQMKECPMCREPLIEQEQFERLKQERAKKKLEKEEQEKLKNQ